MLNYWRSIAWWKRILVIIFTFSIIAELWFRYRVTYSEAKFNIEDKSYTVISHENGKICADSWLRKDSSGLYELYVQGNPMERGLKMGNLLRELLEKQENVFVREFDHFIPNWFFQKGIQRMVAWFNRDMEKHIPIEYLEEIYGVSRFAPANLERVGPAYQRMVNYHGAHDIGHALQNLNLVACTSFGVWGQNTDNQDILIGRNFDFYVNDAFAENKIVCMEKPEKGFGMVYITWAGFIGVVSGMNEKGLSVTLNAAPSEIPYYSASPVSLIGREVLQYAENIQQAYAIIQKRQVFVSETFMIGSLTDNKVVIIEKTPEKTEIVEGENKILCTNHFQSKQLKNTEINLRQIKDNATTYRMNRLEELTANRKKYSVNDIVEILRDTKGQNNSEIGLCNEGAINQLIAHHSVIFSLKEKKMWVTANPWACGAFIQYNLDSIFYKHHLKITSKVGADSQNVKPDKFLQTTEYENIKFFKSILLDIRNSLGKVELMAREDSIVASNPNYFGTYFMLAEYWFERKNKSKALMYIDIGLLKIIPSNYEKQKMLDLRKKIIGLET